MESIIHMLSYVSLAMILYMLLFTIERRSRIVIGVKKI